MTNTVEFLLTLLVLSALYFATPVNVSRNDNSGIRGEQVVIVADGSDPMPLCRGKYCK